MKKGRYLRPKAVSGWKRTLVVILIVVLVFAGVLGGAYLYFNSALHKITQAKFEEKIPADDLNDLIGKFDETEPVTMPAAEIPTETEATEAPTQEVVEVTESVLAAPVETGPVDYGQSGKIVNIMVIGQDYRPDEGHKLADTIMLFTLNKENKTLTVTSFLRDSYVKLPEAWRGHTCGWNRINTSYALGFGWFGDAGAMEMLNVTIEGNFGVHIDGNVEISLETFEVVIDILGGVDIVLEGDELTYMNNVADVYSAPHFFEGNNHLDGREALWYARMRHANNADSDINRAARQRLIIDKVVQKCKSMNLLQLNNLVNQVLPLIVTNISTDDMMMYITEVLPYILDLELVPNQCPAEGTYWGEMVELPDGLSGVLKMDYNKNRELLQAICEDDA